MHFKFITTSRVINLQPGKIFLIFLNWFIFVEMDLCVPIYFVVYAIVKSACSSVASILDFKILQIFLLSNYVKNK